MNKYKWLKFAVQKVDMEQQILIIFDGVPTLDRTAAIQLFLHLSLAALKKTVSGEVKDRSIFSSTDIQIWPRRSCLWISKCPAYFCIPSTFMFKLLFSMYEVNHSYQVHLLNGQPSVQSVVCWMPIMSVHCYLLWPFSTNLTLNSAVVGSQHSNMAGKDKINPAV